MNSNSGTVAIKYWKLRHGFLAVKINKFIFSIITFSPKCNLGQFSSLKSYTIKIVNSIKKVKSN